MNIFEFINAESEHPLVPNRVKSPVLACDIQVVSQGSKWNSVQILRSQSTKVFVQKSFIIRGGIALHCCSGLTVHQRETITVIYIAPLSGASFPPPFHLSMSSYSARLAPCVIAACCFYVLHMIVYILSLLLSQFLLAASSPALSISLFSMSVSPSLLCKQAHGCK